MSPEQAQGKEAGTASDIFSFGVLLYEMIAGRRPFEGENSATVMASILKSEPAPLQDPALWRIVARCLAKDPDHRWQSAADLKAALEWFDAPSPRIRAPVSVSHDRDAAWPSLPPLSSFCRDRDRALPRAVIRKANDLAGRCDSPQRLARRIAHRLPLRRTPVYPRDQRWNTAPRPRFRGRRDEYAVLVPGRRLTGVHLDGNLQIVSANGGAPRALGHVGTTLPGAWGPDGTILIGMLNDGIFRIPSSGGALTRVTTVDPGRNETRHMMPQFLPDGRRFLFTAGSDRPGGSMIYAASLDSPDRTPIVQAGSNAAFIPARRGSSRGFLLYERNGTLLATAFDAATLRLSGEPFPLANSLASVATIGSAAHEVDFSATPGTLAWRAAGRCGISYA